jgi:hypothetical protein
MWNDNLKVKIKKENGIFGRQLLRSKTKDKRKDAVSWQCGTVQ